MCFFFFKKRVCCVMWMCALLFYWGEAKGQLFPEVDNKTNQSISTLIKWKNFSHGLFSQQSS